MVFFKVSKCILMILLISALFYVNIRVVHHEYIHWLYDWGYRLKVRKSHPNVKIYNIYYELLFSVGYWKLKLGVYA